MLLSLQDEFAQRLFHNLSLYFQFLSEYINIHFIELIGKEISYENN